MITYPRAKVNIGLGILRKREDGYHDIETIMYPIGLSDALEFVVPAVAIPGDRLSITGLEAGCRPEDNLVIRAVQMIRKFYNIPWLNIHLHKLIPAGSGLGGGSSDCASMLRILNRYFKLGLGNDDLRKMALELGSDCPFFISPDRPALAAGRGELLTPLPSFLEGYHMVVIHPGIHIPTAMAYNACRPRERITGIADIPCIPVAEWEGRFINDFEEYAFRQYPMLEKTRSNLLNAGALYSSMSGSGSALYGIFREEPAILPPGKIIWQGRLQ